MKTLKLSLFAAIIAVALSGCAGKDGAPGATGPQGATGNANVLSSTFTVIPSNWVASGANLVAAFTASIIDVNVYNYGAVEAYYLDAATNEWVALPWTYTIAANVTQTMGYSYDGTSGFYLQMSNSDGTLPAAPASFSVKIVAIPPAIMKSHPNTNWKSYPEVKQVLNLRD